MFLFRIEREAPVSAEVRLETNGCKKQAKYSQYFDTQECPKLCKFFSSENSNSQRRDSFLHFFRQVPWSIRTAQWQYKAFSWPETFLRTRCPKLCFNGLHVNHYMVNSICCMDGLGQWPKILLKKKKNKKSRKHKIYVFFWTRLALNFLAKYLSGVSSDTGMGRYAAWRH